MQASVSSDYIPRKPQKATKKQVTIQLSDQLEPGPWYRRRSLESAHGGDEVTLREEEWADGSVQDGGKLSCCENAVSLEFGVASSLEMMESILLTGSLGCLVDIGWERKII